MRMPQPCHAFTDDDLEEYLLGHSPLGQASSIVYHCRSCRGCQVQLTELEGFILGLKLALSRVDAEALAATEFEDHDMEETDYA